MLERFVGLLLIKAKKTILLVNLRYLEVRFFFPRKAGAATTMDIQNRRRVSFI